jgi:hypothetical protein
MPSFYPGLNRLLKCPQLDTLRIKERFDKPIVFVLCQRTIDIVAFVLFACAIARSPKRNLHVDGVGVYDGCNGIEEEEMILSA